MEVGGGCHTGGLTLFLAGVMSGGRDKQKIFCQASNLVMEVATRTRWGSLHKNVPPESRHRVLEIIFGGRPDAFVVTGWGRQRLRQSDCESDVALDLSHSLSVCVQATPMNEPKKEG